MRLLFVSSTQKQRIEKGRKGKKMNNILGGGISLFLANIINSLKEEIKDIKNKISRFDLYLNNQKTTYTKIDINTITHTSFGYCNSCINKPANSGNGFLETKESSGITLQTYYEYNAGRIYTRFYIENNFTEWKQV